MATRLLYEFLNFTEMNNATSLDCIVPNCTGLCLYDACLESPPPIVSVTHIHLRRPDRLLPTLLITAAALIAFAFLLLLSFYLFLHRRRLLRRRSHQNPQNPADGADDPFDEEEGGDFADHPVWYIRTVGLEDSTIRSIAAWVYKADDGLVDGSDCSVCLGEFADGELVRLLPKCSHAFHLSCIDTWLRSHVNCPLCRAPILSPAAATAAAVDPPPADVAPESVASDDDLETPRIALQPGNMDQEEEKESESGVGTKSLAGPSSELPEELVEDGLQPVRRSVSMDALSLGKLLVGVGPEERPGEEEVEEGRAVKNLGKVGRVSKAGFLVQKDPLGMERSLSSRSGRYLFGRGRRSSVLPL